MQMRRGPTPAARTRRNAPRGPGRSAGRCAGSGARSGCAAGNANRKCASDERAVRRRYLRGRVIRRVMGGDRFTPGFAFMLAGLSILFVSGAFEAEVVLTQSLRTQGYQGTADLVRLSAVPCAARVLRRLHDHAGIALRRLGVAPRGARAHRLVRSLEARRPPARQPTVRLRATRRRLERNRSRSCVCTRPGALDDLREPPSTRRAPRDAKLDMSAALARPTSPMGT